jgi:methionyl-tRNA formyltransferase
VLAEQRFPIGDRDDAGDVRARALELGYRCWSGRCWSGPGRTPNPTAGITYAHKIGAGRPHLDWSRPAVELDRVVRALSPHIGAHCLLDGRPFVIWRARPLGRGPAVVGEVSAPLVVGCAEGPLELLELQPAGKRRMSGEEFLRGLRSSPARHRERGRGPFSGWRTRSSRSRVTSAT